MHGTTVKTIEINFSLQSSTDIIFTKWLLLQYRQYGVIASAVSYNFRHAEFEAEIVCNSIHVGQRNVWVWAWNLIIAWTAQRDRQQSSLCFLREILLTSGNSAKLCTSRGRQQQLNTGEVKLGRIIGDLYGNFFSHGGHMLKVSTLYDDLFASIFTLWAGQLSRYSDWLRAGRSNAVYCQNRKCFWNSYNAAWPFWCEPNSDHVVPTAAVCPVLGSWARKVLSVLHQPCEVAGLLCLRSNPHEHYFLGNTLKGCNLYTNLHGVTFNMTRMFNP